MACTSCNMDMRLENVKRLQPFIWLLDAKLVDTK